MNNNNDTHNTTSVIIDEMVVIGILEASIHDRTLVRISRRFINSIDISGGTYSSSTRSILKTIVNTFRVTDKQAICDYMLIIDDMLNNLANECLDDRGNLIR